jgi:hypothetical protein
VKAPQLPYPHQRKNVTFPPFRDKTIDLVVTASGQASKGRIEQVTLRSIAVTIT